MKTHHKEEMALLICQQWDLVACLEDEMLTTKQRQSLHLQLAKNVYHMAYIVDVYQNPFIVFHYRGKSYELYSDVIKDSHFELPQAESLLRKVFALHRATSVQVIEVGELYRPVNDFIHAGLEFLRKKVML
ncbi:MAG: hypothetical protein JWM14_138 [Chitinophagaceae bacterium]|nr:hypothetical protein [Chitinophagaceae bacterium]